MTAAPVKVLFLLAEFPSYRRGVLSVIAGDPRVEASFFGDSQPRVAGIESFDANVLGRTIHGRNLRIGQLFWQVGAFTAVRRTRPQVVVFLGDAKVVSTWLLAALCRLLRIRTMFWTIGWHRPERGLKRWSRLAFYRLANDLLIYGKQGYRYGSSLGYPADRMTIIGNSADGPSPSNRSVPRVARTAAVCVGRLTSAKRLDLVVSAAALVDGVTVEFVGGGPERDNLEELAARLGVTCVFHGESHDPALIAEVYSRAICTVIPGAAGLSVTQSLAYGVPVITNNSPENQMPEVDAVIDGVTGSLCERLDVSSVATAIRHWRSLSDEEWRAASAACEMEYRTGWTPAHHADLIVRAVTRRTGGGDKAEAAARTDLSSIERVVFWQNAPSIHFAPLIRAMVRRGYEVHLVTEFDLATERRELGWETPDFVGASTHCSPTPAERRVLEAKLAPNSHHIFTGTGAYPQTFGSLKRVAADPAANGRLCVFTESWNPYDWKAPLRALRYVIRSRAIPQRVDTLLATGSLAVNQFRLHARKSVDVQPFVYSVDVDPTAAQDADTDGPILFVGKLEQRKRVDLLLHAYADAKLLRQLVIVGDGPEKPRLERLAQELGLSGRVTFAGTMSNREARQHMARARALVLPSRFDGWGAVVNEAIHAGAYVIVSAHCGASELISDGRGAIFDDHDGLVNALVGVAVADEAWARQERSKWAMDHISPDTISAYLSEVLERQSGSVVSAPWLE